MKPAAVAGALSFALAAKPDIFNLNSSEHSPSWDNKLITSFHRWGAIMPPTFVSTRKQIMSGGTGSLHKLVDKH
ncbi:hypothetical protein MY4038_008444 [Beauveria bassiana]